MAKTKKDQGAATPANSAETKGVPEGVGGDVSEDTAAVAPKVESEKPSMPPDGPKAEHPKGTAVGRVVHFGDAPHAAMVTRLNSDGTVNLAVFHDGMKSTQYVDNVWHWTGPKAKHWSWPPRV